MRYARSSRRLSGLAFLLAVFLTRSAAHAAEISARWEGGNGNWSNQNWEEDLPCHAPDCDYGGPNGGNYNVLIDSPATLNVNVNVSVNSLTSSGGSLVLNGTSLSVPTQIATLASVQLSNEASITTPTLVTQKLTMQDSTMAAYVVAANINGNSVANISGSHVNRLAFAGQLTLSDSSIGSDSGLNALELLAPSSIAISDLKNAFVSVDQGASLDVSNRSQINIAGAPGVTYGLVIGGAVKGEMDVSGGSHIVVPEGAQTLIGGAAGSNGTLTLHGGATGSSAGLEVGLSGSGLLVLNDQGTTWTNASHPVTVGDGGEGSVFVQNGAVLDTAANLLVMGKQQRAFGSVTIDGPGSRLKTTSLVIGDDGIGSLTIKNGGIGASTTAELGNGSSGMGAVSVSGEGSQWHISSALVVGTVGQGAVTVQDGGEVVSIGLDIGHMAGSQGMITLDGANTLYINGGGGSKAIVGDAGTGSLTVSNGATLKDNAGLLIGKGGNGTVTIVTGAGAGGAVSTVGASVGLSGKGKLVVTGPGSELLSDGDLSVGSLVGPGSGRMFVTLGGMVTDERGFIEPNGSAFLSDVGSTWSNGTSLEVGMFGSGSLTVLGGALVSAGTLTNPGTITIGPHGTVDDKGGTLQGTVIVQSGGVLDPARVANVAGNLTVNNGGTLSLEVAGKGPGDLGQLDVSGNAVFHGTVMLDFIDGFAPVKGDTFDLIQVMGGGDFAGAAIDISGLKPGFEFTDGFAHGEFTLTALNNGVSGGNSVPEPGALLLLGTGLGLMGLLGRRYRRAA